VRSFEIDKLTRGAATDFQGRVETAINGRVYPAYKKLIRYFGRFAKDDDDDGFYLENYRRDGVLRLLPARKKLQLHTQPMKFTGWACGKLARIEGEMRTLLDRQSALQASRSEKRMDNLGKIRVFFFPTTTKAAPIALAEYTQLHQ